MTEKKIINGVQHSVAGVIFRENRVLMFKREGESWETGWEFVKGAVHVGETDEEAVLREIDEEAGVAVEILGKLPGVRWDRKPYEGGYLTIHASVFTCKYISGQVRLGEPEHVDWKWMSLEEAMSKIWIKNGGEMIREAYELYTLQR